MPARRREIVDAAQSAAAGAATPAPSSTSRTGPGRSAGGAAGLLFLSGLSGLVYQILWVKQLSLVVGADVHAITAGVSAFFAGLAVGGFLFGRLADRSLHPERLFAGLEFTIALLGIAATWGLARAAGPFATLEASAGPFAWLIPLLLVGIPATAMGGSVPVLIRGLTRHGGDVGSAGGTLYAANTAGAVAGTLLAPFVLIPAFGLFGAACAAAAINGLAAVGGLLRDLQQSRFPDGTTAKSLGEAADPTPPESTENSRLALLLYSIAGGIALGYEVVWSQVVVQWTSTRTAAFATVLAVYLVGLALGSGLLARRVDRLRDPWGMFGFLIAAAGFTALVEVALLGPWLTAIQTQVAAAVFSLTGTESAAMPARFLIAATAIVFLPTLLLGAAFPVALRLIGRTSRSGGDSGLVLALNSAGGIAGSFLTGFLLVPSLGLERTLAGLAIAAALVGGAAILRGAASMSLPRWGLLTCGLASIAAAFLIPPDHLARLLAASRKGRLEFYAPGAGGTVAVLRQGSGPKTFRRLYIQGVSNSGDSMTSLRYMRLQALLPVLVHSGEPKSALVIGLGTGITAGTLLHCDSLDRRVCAELMPEVARAAHLFQGNAGVTTDPGVDIRLRDGRRELLRSGERYDVITLEPPPPAAAGVVNLYSRDFYELASRRLERGGILAQWLPLPTQTGADTRSLIRSFLDVFPHATFWTTEVHEMLLMGSQEPMPLDLGAIRSRFEQPGIRTALTEVGIPTAEALLATYVCDRPGLEQYAGATLPVTDDRPRIEYGPWVPPGEFERTLVQLLGLQSDPPLADGSETDRQRVRESRRRLHTFYATALYAYEGERRKWEETLTLVLREDPDNPYFRWFAGDGGTPAP